MRIYQPMDGEKEILHLRRFPWFVVLLLGRLFIRAVVPLLVLTIFLLIFSDWSFENAIVKYSLATFMIYLAGLVLFAFVEWFNDELDILVVTNKRIIIFIQHTLFNRHSSIASLEQVQDVKGVMNGFLQNLLSFGNLEIQTAADKIQFRIEEIPNPDRASRIINTELQRIRDSKAHHEHLPEEEIKDHENSGSLIQGVKHNDYLDEVLHDTREQMKKVV